MHYSLPRRDEQKGPCPPDKGQGSVMATIRGARFLNEADLGGMAERYGQIKRIQAAGSPE